MTWRGTTVGAALVAADLGWDIRWTTLAMVGVILLGATVIALVARWRKRAARGLSASDQLAEFRALYREGAISKEEFERLRAVLGGELRRSLDVPPPDKTSLIPEPAQPPIPQPNSSREEKPEPPANGFHPG